MNSSVTFIILGASGDLAKRKILPALYRLVESGKVTRFAIIGASIDDSTPEQLVAASREFIPGFKDEVGKKILNNLLYQKIDFTNQEDFQKLATIVEKVEQQHELSGNRIVYCATSPQFFCAISQHVERAGIIKRQKPHQQPYQRIVYEKPFGSDFKSAAHINACLEQLFDESQIFRVDHYLGKELVGNIALVRFANSIFEPLWNNKFIEFVHIILSEQVGLEGRGAYYDAYGVLKDVVQNHMLQMLALVAMESPRTLTGMSIREEKTKVLEKVRTVSGILGQYEHYTQEKDVNPSSSTPTFAALELAIDNERWKNVPFYFSTGKKLDKKETEIRIKFKTVVCALQEASLCEPNILTVRIAPEAGFTLRLNAKKPGQMYQTTPVDLDFCYNCVFLDTPQEYETMLYQIMQGDESISVRFDAIEYSWKIIDACVTMNLPVYTYKQGSKGPEQALKWAQEKGIEW